MRSIAQPTVQQLAAEAEGKIKLIRPDTLSDFYLWSTCAHFAIKENFSRLFPSSTCDYWNEKLQTKCNIDAAYLNLVITVPEELPKFLFTLLSQIFPYSDLSQPIGTLDWTGQFYWFPISSWHNKDCQRTTEMCPWLKCNPGCYITSTLELLTRQELVQGAAIQGIKIQIFCPRSVTLIILCCNHVNSGWIYHYEEMGTTMLDLRGFSSFFQQKKPEPNLPSSASFVQTGAGIWE